MVIVGKHINGITINPLEYLLDETGDVLEFDDESTAREYLRDKGLTDDELDSLVFCAPSHEDETESTNPDEQLPLAPPKQEAGTCPVCGNEDLEYGDSGIEDTSYYYRWECSGCDRSGREWHNLVFDEHIIDTDVSCEG